MFDFSRTGLLKKGSGLIKVILTFAVGFVVSCASLEDMAKRIRGSGEVTTNDLYAVFVSLSGSDTNPGTKLLPVQTIQTAVNIVAAHGEGYVCVAQGIYTPGSGLNANGSGVVITNNNVHLVGGYSGDFSARSALSDLRGTNGLTHIIECRGTSNLTIDGFIVREGNANGPGESNTAGGVFLLGITNSSMNDVVIYGNNAGNSGGMEAISCFNCDFDLTVSNNTAVSTNGGIALVNCSNVSLSGLINNNRSSNAQAGGLHILFDQDISLNVAVSNNTTSNYGGGIVIEYSTNVSLTGCSVVGNMSTNHGGGLYVDYSSNFSMTGCAVNGNVTSNYGGGLIIQRTLTRISNCVVNNNYGKLLAGGLFFYTARIEILDSTINNNAGGNGGGIYLNGYNCIDIIRCDISGNSAVSSSGISQGTCYSINLLSCTLTNNWTSSASGAVIFLGAGNLITNFVISNCVIGSTNNSATWAMRESTGIDMTNHVLIGNTFITNKLGSLYYDNNGVHVVTNSASGWTNINNKIYTTAQIDTGNTVIAQ